VERILTNWFSRSEVVLASSSSAALPTFWFWTKFLDVLFSPAVRKTF